jgi:hypothetical protein
MFGNGVLIITDPTSTKTVQKKTPKAPLIHMTHKNPAPSKEFNAEDHSYATTIIAKDTKPVAEAKEKLIPQPIMWVLGVSRI